MALGETESCGSRAASPPHARQQRHKLEAYNEVLRLLSDSGHPDCLSSSFEDELWTHFQRLPAWYALEVNVERLEHVLTHKRLLRQAQDTAGGAVFDVRLVQRIPVHDCNQADISDPNLQGEEHAQNISSCLSKQSIHPPPAFGSSPNLEALALEARMSNIEHMDSDSVASQFARPMHEITFSTYDKPKVLSQLTTLLAEMGLNIQEAHVFSTNDGFSLDVFVVDGWPYEESEQLKDMLQKKVQRIEKQTLSNSCPWPPVSDNPGVGEDNLPQHVQIPTDETDVWEIDVRKLKFGKKVASGSYGDLYQGIYCSQDVAVKVLKPERVSVEMQREFAQEVYILRKVRHRNVVQFIGACTKPPSLFIITEFMSGGSIYDFLHKQNGAFKLPALLRVAIDVSKGMNYLHQNNIVHRDLKTANLLIGENEGVKVADFGVARVKSQSGVMTAETGTYRWMAPEVIEHKPYDHKADVFSFGIVLWELLTGKIPYEFLTPVQAAVGVVQKSLRPTIPKHTHPKLAKLLERCWQKDPVLRPDFTEILETLTVIAKEVGKEPDERRKEKSSSGFLSVLKRGH